MEEIKVSIIGNSVGLRVRPPVFYPNNKNYGVRLKELLQYNFPDKCITVNNLCVGRSTILKTLSKIDDIVAEFPNYYVINTGVTDASTREIPLWFSDFINSKKESFFRSFFMAFYIYVLIKIRPILVILRGKRPWISIRLYSKCLKKLIKLLIKETNAKIILLSINQTTERVDSQLLGSSKNYELYNKISKSIADELNVIYLDTTDLEPELYVPDGIHFSLEGNEIIAQRLSEIITK